MSFWKVVLAVFLAFISGVVVYGVVDSATGSDSLALIADFLAAFFVGYVSMQFLKEL